MYISAHSKLRETAKISAVRYTNKNGTVFNFLIFGKRKKKNELWKFKNVLSRKLINRENLRGFTLHAERFNYGIHEEQ